VKHRRKWEDIIKMDFRDGRDWFILAQDSVEYLAFANTFMKLRFP